MPDARRQHDAAIVIGKVLIGAIDAGLVARRLGDAGLEIVGHQRFRHAADRGQHVHMRADPVGQRLAPAGLRVGVIGRAERGHEDVCVAFFTGRSVEQCNRIASPINEQLLACHMALPHRRRDALAPGAVALAEPTISAASGMLGAILLPQQRQRHPAPLQLRMNMLPVRLSAGPRARCRPRRSKQPPLQFGIGDRLRNRPGQTHSGGTPNVIPKSRLPDPRHLADNAPAHPHRMRQTQYVAYLPHRHSLRRHRSLPGLPGRPIS